VSEEKVSYYEDFSEIEKKLWSLLVGAVKDRSSEFRTPVFICGNDKDLDGRIVILRKTDQKNKDNFYSTLAFRNHKKGT